MKAFITGSRAYGVPRDNSDLDLVVFLGQADLERLVDFGFQRNATMGSGTVDNMSLQFGDLNLIALSDWEEYEIWRDGTQELQERTGRLTHDESVRFFEVLRRFRDKEKKNQVAVTSSLFQMVRIVGTRPLWPADFEGKIQLLDANPNDKAQWGIIADWLDENDESELGAAFRWVHKRDSVKVVTNFSKSWWFDGLPGAVSVYWRTNEIDTTTIPGLAACLAVALQKTKEDIS